jgi:putative SOS response-associated peptidase YedK
MKTINARDDSLMENKGIWNVPKRRKRCIVVAQGFYEWLKKNNGKDRIPHYIKRKDNQLMMMAGLWDCVSYEGMLNPLHSIWSRVNLIR